MCVQMGFDNTRTISSVTDFFTSAVTASPSSNNVYVEECSTKAGMNSDDKSFSTNHQDLLAQNQSLKSRNDELKKHVTDLEAKLFQVEKNFHQLQEKLMDLLFPIL